MYDVALATSTYFGGKYGNVTDPHYRRRLFDDLCDSLEMLDKGGKRICWIIGDDCSPAGPPEKMEMPFDVFVLTRPQNVGQPQNYLQTVQRACREAEWVLVVDDDAIVADDCIIRLFDLVGKHPECDCYGAFNSPYHPVIQDCGDYVLKHSTCELGRFFRAEWGGFGVTRKPIPVLKPSGIQHCGKFGLNGTADDYDRDFRARTALSAR